MVSTCCCCRPRVAPPPATTTRATVQNPTGSGTETGTQDTKRKEAILRQEEYASLTPIQKLQNLNKKLGENLGAKKERRKLQNAIR